MDRSLGRRVDNRQRQRHEAQPRAGIGNHRIVLALQLLDQRGRHPDVTDEIRLDRRQHQCVVHLSVRAIEHPNAGIVDQNVEFWVFGDEPGGGGIDARTIGNVEFDCRHPGIGGNDLIQVRLASPRDDDRVAELMECLGEAAAYAGGGAGY
jgi:hypothetical protein